ncbi:MAG: hypothetical protein ACK5FE_08080 [Cyanobacteriota bacterium]
MGLLLFFWRILLVVLALAGLVFGLVWLWRVLRLSRLRTLCKTADRRFAGDVCRCSQGGFGLLESIGLEDNGGRPRLQLAIRRLCLQEEDFQWCDDTLLLAPPPDLRSLRGNVAFAAFLARHGVVMVNDLAVEAKATKATKGCFEEAQWARSALEKMEVMIESTTATLAKARDNELLQPAIPQLQGALDTFVAEQRKLRQHLDHSLTMLRKLHDFLEVPEAIRPILSFDLDQVFDPSRFRDLESSFQEVVTLNDAFRQLSREIPR